MLKSEEEMIKFPAKHKKMVDTLREERQSCSIKIKSQ